MVKPLERFLKKIKKTGKCWEWLGFIGKCGYGYFSINRKLITAHRAAYIFFKGDAKKGLVVDHLCRNKSCVNPKHLELVTYSVNALRGVNVGKHNGLKKHCPKGHPYSGSNVKYRPRGKYIERACRTCRKYSKNEGGKND